MKSILVINAGSSSLKFQVFGVGGETLTRRLRGQLGGLGVRPTLRIVDADGGVVLDREYDGRQMDGLEAAHREVRGWLDAQDGYEFVAVGHRVVHGGPEYARPVVVDEAVLARLADYEPLAPLHQPHNLALIRLAMDHDPGVPQVACFDTAFHRDHPQMADWYALPRALHEEGVRRYGFHGLSYEYIATRLRELDPDMAAGRVIVAHLGNGASMCALRDGRSVECTLGFTALDGIPMGTRPGQLDPGVILYLLSGKGMGPDEVSDLLYRESGLKGLSGVSSDMRELLASDDPHAAFAVEFFVHRIGLYAGMLAAALGGLDGFVFTGGIGEHAAPVRAGVVERLGWLGASLDGPANDAGHTRISAPDSRITLYVVPTDEELMIARHTLALLGAAG